MTNETLDPAVGTTEGVEWFVTNPFRTTYLVVLKAMTYIVFENGV